MPVKYTIRLVMVLGSYLNQNCDFWQLLIGFNLKDKV